MGMSDLKSFLKMDGVECLAVCDVDRNVLEKRAAEAKEIQGKAPQLYDDYRKLLEHKDLDGAVRIKIVSPVTGYEEVWRRVLERFVNDTGVANASFEINDNNATPVVVSLRLRQALAEIS